MVDPETLSDAQIAAARAAGDTALTGPRAVAARYLPERDRVEIDLASGWSVQVPRSFLPRLAAAAPEVCAQLEVIDGGLGLHWRALDEDWFVPAVIESVTLAHA